MLVVSRPWRIAVCFSVMAALGGGPLLAAEGNTGSKNFRPPTGVPNYFSNETGPMLGGPAESRRGDLYPGQRPAAAAPQQTAVAPIVQGRTHVAMATHRQTRLDRTRHVGPASSRRVASHTRPGVRTVAHTVVHNTRSPHPGRPAAKAAKTQVSHRRARG